MLTFVYCTSRRAAVITAPLTTIHAVTTRQERVFDKECDVSICSFARSIYLPFYSSSAAVGVTQAGSAPDIFSYLVYACLVVVILTNWLVKPVLNMLMLTSFV